MCKKNHSIFLEKKITVPAGSKRRDEVFNSGAVWEREWHVSSEETHKCLRRYSCLVFRTPNATGLPVWGLTRLEKKAHSLPGGIMVYQFYTIRVESTSLVIMFVRVPLMLMLSSLCYPFYSYFFVLYHLRCKSISHCSYPLTLYLDLFNMKYFPWP